MLEEPILKSIHCWKSWFDKRLADQDYYNFIKKGEFGQRGSTKIKYQSSRSTRWQKHDI